MRQRRQKEEEKVCFFLGRIVWKPQYCETTPITVVQLNVISYEAGNLFGLF